MTDKNYCPFCSRNIEPATDEDGEIIRFEDGGLIYVHDDVPHDEDYTFEELH